MFRSLSPHFLLFALLFSSAALFAERIKADLPVDPPMPDQVRQMRAAWESKRSHYDRQFQSLYLELIERQNGLENVIRDLKERGKPHAANFYLVAAKTLHDLVRRLDREGIKRVTRAGGSLSAWYFSLSQSSKRWQERLTNLPASEILAISREISDEWQDLRARHHALWGGTATDIARITLDAAGQNDISPREALAALTRSAFPLFSPTRFENKYDRGEKSPLRYSKAEATVQIGLTPRQIGEWNVWNERRKLLSFLYVSLCTDGRVGLLTEYLGSAQFEIASGVPPLTTLNIFRDTEAIEFILDGGPNGAPLNVRFRNLAWRPGAAADATYDSESHSITLPVRWEKNRGALPLVMNRWRVTDHPAPQRCSALIEGESAKRRGP